MKYHKNIVQFVQGFEPEASHTQLFPNYEPSGEKLIPHNVHHESLQLRLERLPGEKVLVSLGHQKAIFCDHDLYRAVEAVTEQKYAIIARERDIEHEKEKARAVMQVLEHPPHEEGEM